MPLKIVRNDLLKMKVDAIVNPTDYCLSGSGSIDLQVHTAGGEDLKKECSKFGHCDFGDVVLTNAYNLPCKYIMHTVGPFWNGDPNVFEILESCYKNCLKLAYQMQLKTIAFPLISTGSFLFPKDKALQIALNTINVFLMEHAKLKVYLVVYSADAYGLSKNIIDEVKEYISDSEVTTPPKVAFTDAIAFYRDRNIPLCSEQIRTSTYISEDVHVRLKPFVERMEENRIFTDKTMCCCAPIMGMTTVEPEVDMDKLKKVRNEYHSHFRDKLEEYLVEFDLLSYQGKKMLRECSMITSATFSNLDLNYVVPDKKTVFKYLLALPLTYDEAMELLESAGYSINFNDKIERIINCFLFERNSKINRNCLYSVSTYDNYIYDIFGKTYFQKNTKASI